MNIRNHYKTIQNIRLLPFIIVLSLCCACTNDTRDMTTPRPEPTVYIQAAASTLTPAQEATPVAATPSVIAAEGHIEGTPWALTDAEAVERLPPGEMGFSAFTAVELASIPGEILAVTAVHQHKFAVLTREKDYDRIWVMDADNEPYQLYQAPSDAYISAISGGVGYVDWLQCDEKGWQLKTQMLPLDEKVFEVREVWSETAAVQSVRMLNANPDRLELIYLSDGYWLVTLQRDEDGLAVVEKQFLFAETSDEAELLDNGCYHSEMTVKKTQLRDGLVQFSFGLENKAQVAIAANLRVVDYMAQDGTILFRDESEGFYSYDIVEDRLWCWGKRVKWFLEIEPGWLVYADEDGTVLRVADVKEHRAAVAYAPLEGVQIQAAATAVYEYPSVYLITVLGDTYDIISVDLEHMR